MPAASSIERSCVQRIFGVGQTFAKLREVLSSASASATPRKRRHFGIENLGGIRAEYGMLRWGARNPTTPSEGRR